MGMLLTDEPLPILEGIALLAVGIALLLASVARERSQRSANRVTQVIWRDVSQAGFIWAAATLAILVGDRKSVV